jgi:PhzF family phenazine biosynthesis protein
VKHPYCEVDVFTDVPLKGNPLAVVFEADNLSTEQMQTFANWTNLSETSFVLKPTDPQADYRVRIFTPSTEFKFAGHPTLGTCHAWLEHGGKAKREGIVVQECGIGLVNVHQRNGGLAFEAPPTKATNCDATLLSQVCSALGVDSAQVQAAQWLDNGGPPWLSLLLPSAEQVLALEPDHAALKTLAKVGVIGAYEDKNYKALDIGVIGAHKVAHDCAFEVRAFAAAVGVYEDPVTGSLNASFARWMMGMGKAPPRYTVSQGTRLGRAGRVQVEALADDVVLIGGASITCVRGELSLP